jgi:hypothetical protein
MGGLIMVGSRNENLPPIVTNATNVVEKGFDTTIMDTFKKEIRFLSKALNIFY